MPCYIRQGLVLCLLACSLTFVTATQASERESHSVEVTFYQLSTSQWNSATAAFKTHVAAEARTYCTNNPTTCGLDASSGFLFSDSQVGVSSGPTEDSKSLKIKFYIDFPTVHVLGSNSPTTHVVNSAAVTTILTNIRNSLETTVGADITYIGSEFYSIDPASTLNKVLIPIAFIVLLAVIITAIVLHVWNQRKEKEEKKKQRALEREKRKKTSRIVPVYTEETEAQKANANWLRLSRKKKTLVRQDGSTNGSVMATLSLKTNMMTYNTSQPAKGSGATADGVSHPEYEDPVPLRTSALPPLPDPDDDTKEQKQEKKEKKRRKREKRHSAKKEGEESEGEFSKTESLEKSTEKNIVPVEEDV